MSAATQVLARPLALSEALCLQLGIIGRGAAGATIRLSNGASRSFVGAKEATVPAIGPGSTWLPMAIVTILESPQGNLMPWAADLVLSNGEANAVAIRFGLPLISKPWPSGTPGDLQVDEEGFARSRANADALLPATMLVRRAEDLFACWSLAEPAPKARAAKLAESLARALGAEALSSFPLHGFHASLLSIALLARAEAGRAYDFDQVAQVAAGKVEKR